MNRNDKIRNVKLFAWGANTYGQLGLGEKSELCSKPIEVAFSCEPIIFTDIAGGGGHSLASDMIGNVYACGWNSKGQLGFSNLLEETLFKNVEAVNDHSVTNVYCGWDTSYVVTRNGKLYGWGSNVYGQLGIPKKQLLHTSTPVQMMDRGVRQVSCGLRHTAVVTNDGGLFVCGNGRKCQLGLVNHGQAVEESFELQRVSELPSIQMVACGQHHIVALTVCGKIFVWGDNRFGQLGVDPSLIPKSSVPMELNVEHEKFSGECSVFSGWTHTVIKTGDGKLINWGRNNYGQLGNEESDRKFAWRPQLLENIPPVKHICVGSEHNLAVTDSKTVISWGWNEHGNCGTGTDKDVRKPVPVPIDTCSADNVHIGVGAGHSFAAVLWQK